ncbi:pol, partial [Mucuna pruriens]
MGSFSISNGYSYILLIVDYVSRWVEARAIRTNDAKVVVHFLKSNILCRFGVPRAFISDQKYGVLHRIVTPYHPQTNGQAEVFSRKIKKILLKMVNPTYRMPLGMSPYWIVFGKACHLSAKIEHKAY